MKRLEHARNLYVALWIGAVLAFLLLDFHHGALHQLLSRGESFFAAIFPEVLVMRANFDRGDEGEDALSINPLLQAAAEAKAADMAAKGYFAHTAPDGTPPWYWLHQAGYQFVAAGENLGVNFTESDTLHNAWMLSPSHRRNLLNRRFTEIGIGMAEGIYKGRPATFVVQFFGRPAL